LASPGRPASTSLRQCRHRQSKGSVAV